MQKTFNPIDFGFAWTTDWYEWDRKAAHSAAMKARNTEAKRLRDLGKLVVKFTMRDQLISRGGIGSGKPHVQEVVTIYGINVRDL